MTKARLAVWNIGLSAWIIQDGNYPDFVAGRTAEFAVEFYYGPSTEIALVNADISARLAVDSKYNVVAELVSQTSDVTILDVGILIYAEREGAFPEHQRGARVETTLSFGVDPFFYFEQLSKNPAIPPLIYSWRILSILRQTAPWVEVKDHSGRSMRIRDEHKLGYVEVNRTDAWKDDGGFGEYILRCELLEIDPKRKSATPT
jgi:hypothetical protein